MKFVYILLLISVTILILSFFSCGSSKNDSSKKVNKSQSIKNNSVNNPKKNLPTIVFLGDSLTEGYRVGLEENYPTQVEKKLVEQGIQIKVVNGGLSGDTSEGGLERLNWFLKLEPDYLFLALGSNDGLRGLQLGNTYDNLSSIIEACQERGVKVFLAGLKIPPNYGLAYTQEFEAIFTRLSQKYSLPLYPFLLEGVAGETRFNLEDGIHPNAQGYKIISDGITEFIIKNL